MNPLFLHSGGRIEGVDNIWTVLYKINSHQLFIGLDPWRCGALCLMLFIAGKPCGIDYEMKAYVGDTVEDKPHKRNSVRLAIRKVRGAKCGDILQQGAHVMCR